MLHAVIMAGGSGTRFWPRSRARLPKQLIRIGAPRTMIQETVARVLAGVPAERVAIITNRKHVDETRRQLPDFPPRRIVGEPVGRDTAACVGFGAILARHEDPDAVAAVIPADQRIAPAERFHEALRAAAELAQRQHLLVTFGVRPAEPSTHFGYIERGDVLDEAAGGFPAFRVACFREKPDRATAEEFLRAGRFYWNSGIFVWRAEDILAAIAEHMPELHAGLQRIAAALGGPREQETIAREYPRLTRTSIDYGVMEKAGNVAVIEVDYDWDDVGAWTALPRTLGADENGNTVDADHLAIDTHDCIVAAEEGHLVATVGVEGLIIVQTPDATLVCDRRRAGDVKLLVERLRREGRERCL